MKSIYTYLLFMILIALFLTQGFQCGSPEFTGAKVQEQNKNYVEAAKLYEKEVQKNPANSEAWFRLGRVRGDELRDYTGMNEAFNQSEKTSNMFINDIRAIRYRHWAQRINNGVAFMKRASSDSLSFYDKAIEEYNSANIIWPDTSMTYLYQAAAYKGKGDFDNLIACLKKVWSLDKDKESYKSAGRLYVQRGLDKKEQFKSENADKLKLQKSLSDVDKGSFKTDVMQSFGAPDINKKDKKNPKKEDWTYNQYAMTLTFEGERVISKKMDKPYNLKIDSTKYYESVAEFNNAVNVFESIKAVDSKDNENLNLLLQAYFEANRIKEATSAFKTAVENEPGNKMNHYILGLLHRTVENYDAAIAEFSEAVKIDPNFTDAYFDIGATYYNWGVKMKKATQESGDESTEYKKKFEGALPWMEKVNAIKNDDPKVWETLGTIYAMLGQKDKAIKALDEADKLRKAGK
jgi:tetratricopeptide (TPR) repeat protein